jgi:hypothetical protein
VAIVHPKHSLASTARHFLVSTSLTTAQISDAVSIIIAMSLTLIFDIMTIDEVRGLIDGP